MSEPIDKKLYNEVKLLADKKFKAKTGIYKSSWIVREYKKLNGKYENSTDKNQGLARWFREKWIDLNHPIYDKKGNIIGYKPCGSKVSDDIYPLCRPSKRITKATPITYKELNNKLIKNAKQKKALVREQSNIKFIDIPIPANIIKKIEFAINLSKNKFKISDKSILNVAKRLVNKKTLNKKDIQIISNWYNKINKQAYDKWIKDGKPKTPKYLNNSSILDWLIFGGNAGLKFIRLKDIKSLSKLRNL